MKTYYIYGYYRDQEFVCAPIAAWSLYGAMKYARKCYAEALADCWFVQVGRINFDERHP